MFLLGLLAGVGLTLFAIIAWVVYVMLTQPDDAWFTLG